MILAVRRGSTGSLDFVNRTAGVARHDLLVLAVHEQVEGFEDDRSDKGLVAFGLDNGRKGVIASQELEEDALGFATLPPTAVGITDPDAVAQPEA
jgi:hypothetical protein